MNDTNFVRLAGVALFALICLAACQKQEAPQEILRKVRFEQVYASGGNRVRKFSGITKSGTESKLSFKVAGTVQKVHAKVGHTVKLGQILAELDPSDFDLQAKEADAVRDQAHALEVQARNNYERVQALYENRNASTADLEAARASYESAHEQDNMYKKRRDLARRQLEYTKLIAPMGGAISEVRVEVNENVAAGQTVFVLTAGSQPEVSVAIPEVLISQIKSGQQVAITLDAIPDFIFTGIVTEVGVAAVGYATTYPVVVRFEDSHDDLRPGMAAEVAFTFETQSDKIVYLVPPVAVGEDRLGRFVFVVEASKEEESLGVIHKKPVTIGELTSEGLEILEGLNDGDHLVTAGVSRIVDGQRVHFEMPGGVMTAK